MSGMGLPQGLGFLTRMQQSCIHRAAWRYFELPEDREDFVQSAYLLAYEDWGARGFCLWGPDERADYSCSRHIEQQALRMVIGHRRGEDVVDDEAQLFIFDKIEDQTFGDILDSVVPINPKARAKGQAWTFLMPNGWRIRFTYDELEELTGMTRNSIQRSKRIRQKIKLFQYKGRLFGRKADIQKEFGLTEGAAGYHSERVELEWVDP